MKHFFWLTAVSLFVIQALDARQQQPLVTGLKNPESVVAEAKGVKVFVSCSGDKDGDGAIMVVEKDKAVPLATGLDHPRGLVFYGKSVFVAEKKGILRVDMKGKVNVYVPAESFPTPPIDLRGVAVDPESGTLYVSDSGDVSGKGGAIYRVPGTKGGFGGGFGGKKKDAAPPKIQPTLVTNQTKWPALQRPTGLAVDGQNHLLVLDAGNGTLNRIHLANGSTEKVADGFGSAGGLAWDRYGRLYISDNRAGKVFVIGRPGQAPVLLAEGFKSAADLRMDPTGKFILVADTKAGTLAEVTARVPGAEVDESPLNVEAVQAFPKLHWTDWKSESDTGKQNELRPIVLTHAGDGSNRVFVATQRGVIHVFPNDQNADKTKVFLDIENRVVYNNGQNEEGFLGLAFHPQYKKNGEFFVFYTIKQQDKNKHTNILSRFRVSKDDPNRADRDSEEILVRIERPFWNHDGGTLCFGPDGYLYFNTGDGGSANDPNNNGQNLKTMLAKVLRIDVDHKDPGKNYAIPKDNPFVGRADAIPEIWSYGLRNIWRMAFDRKTGTLWAGDVGQNQFEEIDIIVKGGNYGWKVREGLHPFSAKGVGPRPDLIDPIWEYNHSTVGVCIIGGNVYRGQRVRELQGAYIYGDYPSGKIWALRYDTKAKRVIANQPIIPPNPRAPMLSFGEDEPGETYFVTPNYTGKWIYRFQRKTAKP